MQTIGTISSLAKVLSGKIIVGNITIHQPSIDIRYAADFFSQKIYDESFSEGILTLEESYEMVDFDESQLEQIPKDIDQMKVDYFNSFYSDSNKKFIRKAIKEKQRKLELIILEKNTFLPYTCEAISDQARTLYIIEHCSFVNGVKVNFEERNLLSLYNSYTGELLNDGEIRELSKNIEWKMTWNASKHSPPLFSFPACELTDMQKTLISWTRMYDSIYESPDCPSDDIINDDIAIDGWFVLQRRKRNDEVKKPDNLPKSQEVFVMGKTKEDIRNINNMNTSEGARIVKSRFEELKQKGSLDEGQFSHVRDELQMRANAANFKRS